jgi:uncharacterized lipoprotein YehR (DUF1307 family)
VNKVILNKAFLLITVFVFAIAFASCSKKTYTHTYKAKSRASSSAIDPITPKNEPVRKNYIVPKKRKKILGLEKPKL